MQYVLRERRILAWASVAHLRAAMVGFRTSPHAGQKRIRITMRPWLSLKQRFREFT
jgi:hypothetical protein